MLARLSPLLAFCSCLSHAPPAANRAGRLHPSAAPVAERRDINLESELPRAKLELWALGCEPVDGERLLLAVAGENPHDAVLGVRLPPLKIEWTSEFPEFERIFDEPEAGLGLGVLAETRCGPLTESHVEVPPRGRFARLATVAAADLRRLGSGPWAVRWLWTQYDVGLPVVEWSATRCATLAWSVDRPCSLKMELSSVCGSRPSLSIDLGATEAIEPPPSML